MFFNSNLLTIINIILEGDKQITKKKEKKLNDIFKLTGSNLFMIPCLVKNESFGEMFKRMLTKNGILCIALYRKNLIDNFYYVYTNPRKTTLIKETDYIFILAGTEKIEAYYEQNEIFFENKIKKEKEKPNEFNGDEKIEKGKPSFFRLLQESMKKQYLLLKQNKNIIDNSIKKEEQTTNFDSYNINNMDEDKNIKDNNLLISGNKRHSVFFNLHDEKMKSQKNYKEVEELQIQVNKTMEKLKQLNVNFNEFEKDVDSFIKKEVKDELLVYLNKIKQ